MRSLLVWLGFDRAAHATARVALAMAGSLVAPPQLGSASPSRYTARLLSAPQPAPHRTRPNRRRPGDADDLADQGERDCERRYIFEDDDLKGDVLTPDHEALRAVRRVSHRSLISLRRHFYDRLIPLSEDI